MGYQDRLRLFVIIRNQVLLVVCVSPKCLELWEYFVVVS